MTVNIVGRAVRRGAVVLMMAGLGACSSTGGLGNILGSVLGGNGGGIGGGQQSNQLSGSVQGVDTRSQRIAIQQSNGQSVWVSYDNNTRVVFQNQNYPPTALENGDRVTASIQDGGNGAYYTNYVQVDQSVRGNNGQQSQGQSSNVQTFQGSVRQVDRQNGWFIMDDRNAGRITVLLSNGVSRADINRFNNLRQGDVARIYGYPRSNSQVELRQFY
ncbi:MAG: hypothetical protein ACR2MQ_16330 [Gemmatimonadaceae bacterium]